MLDHSPIAKELDSIRRLASDYFQQTLKLWSEKHEGSSFSYGEVNAFVRSLPPTLADKLVRLESQIATWASEVAGLARSAPLLSAADQGELRIHPREMMAALRFREYGYYETRLLSWEDQVYGAEPASQTEKETFPVYAPRLFSEGSAEIARILLFLQGNDVHRADPIQTVPSVSGAQLRRDTAFIMMWMSDEHPELTDVKVGIAEVFNEFGIKAVRADDIEHEGVITERVLREIDAAEFLIADLTGARPNVYYEIGYAHALGKRPILYRKKDAVLHFDLAGRNVPSYANVTDLKQLLRKRLAALLGIESSVSKSKRTEK